jgi:hypothetical protein
MPLRKAAGDTNTRSLILCQNYFGGNNFFSYWKRDKMVFYQQINHTMELIRRRKSGSNANTICPEVSEIMYQLFMPCPIRLKNAAGREIDKNVDTVGTLGLHRRAAEVPR